MALTQEQRRPPPPGVTLRTIERGAIDDAFVGAAVSVLDRAFDGWPGLSLSVSPAEHLRWKMSGPGRGWPAALIAEAGGRVIAIRTLLVRHVLVRGQRRLFVHFVDAAVDPEWQGRGVNGAMQDVMRFDFQPRFDLSIDDSQSETIMRSRTRLGTIHDFGNQIRPYALVLDPARLFTREPPPRPIPGWVAASSSRLLAASVRATARLGRRHRDPEPTVIETLGSVGEEFERFAARATGAFEFIAERTSEFMNWRYADPRAGRFVMRGARARGELVGYAVTKLGVDMANIVDLLTLPESPAVASALVEDAIGLARQAGADVVSCWLPERHPARSALRAHGFASLRRRTPLKFRAASMPEVELDFLLGRGARIHLTHGDTDMV